MKIILNYDDDKFLIVGDIQFLEKYVGTVV